MLLLFMLYPFSFSLTPSLYLAFGFVYLQRIVYG